MPAQEELRSVAAVDSNDGTICHTVGPENGFEVKSAAAEDANSYVEGYIATNDSYKMAGKKWDEEQLTEEALRSAAQQINEAQDNMMDVKFPEPQDAETITGNIEHQNSPAFKELFPKLIDTRTVPAVELKDAEYDGRGVKVKAEIREHALPDDTVEAVKSNIKEGILSAFSIEFKNAKDKLVRAGDKVVRKIKDLAVTGAGLTAQPKNPNTLMTAAEIRSQLAEEQIRNELPDTGVEREAGVAYVDTKGGELDESEISNEIFEHHYLFAADTKSESSYPVVDANHNLRRGNVEAAHQLGARGGVSEDELKRKLKALNDKFDEPPISFDEEGDEARNDINGDTAVTEQDSQQEEAKSEAAEADESADETQEETKSVADEVEELRSAVDEIRSEKEQLEEAKSELEEENEELRNKLDDLEEDFEEVDEVRNELEDLKEEVKSASPSDEPVSDEDEQRMEETKSETSRLEREINAATDSRKYAEENKSVLADKYGVDEEEVMEHV